MKPIIAFAVLLMVSSCKTTRTDLSNDTESTIPTLGELPNPNKFYACLHQRIENGVSDKKGAINLKVKLNSVESGKRITPINKSLDLTLVNESGFIEIGDSLGMKLFHAELEM